MSVKPFNNNFESLFGEGEMARLTREKNWSKTSVGPMETWPQSLRTTLSIILHSKFPMLLLWGKDLNCFYNDAMRPSLGNEGKHPSMLGRRSEEAWAEVWHIIKPWIDQVLLTGNAVTNEDQLVPFYRNGHIENIYWTFCYSAVCDESGNRAGVFVTCTETTGKVMALNKLAESKSQLEFAIDAADLGTWDYDPLTNKFSSNNRLKSWFGLPEEAEIELTHAISVILESDRQRVSHAIQQALDFSSGGNYEIEYTIINPLTKKERSVLAKGRAWFNNDKIAYRFNGTLEDITQRAATAKQIKETVSRYDHLIYSSPSAIGILYGKNLVITIANNAIIEIWGKGREIIGQPYFEALPELAEQGYREIFASVYETGVPFNAIETPVHISQNGNLTLKYYNFLLYPQRNLNGAIDGIVIIATEVTSQALLNNRIKESEQKLQAAVLAVKGIVWTNNAEGKMQGIQAGWAELTGQKYDEYQGYGWANAIHPDDIPPTLEAWNEAVKNVATFNFEHRVKMKDGSWRLFSVKAIPLKNEDGTLREWVGVHTDIQKQKNFAAELERQVQERTKELTQSNELLKKSEERYHLMVEEVQDYAIIYLDREGVVRNWNAGAEKIKGYKASEIIGNSFSSFYSAEDRGNNLPQKLLAQAVTTGRAVQQGWRVRKNGSLFWASVVITAVHNDKNEVIGFSKVTHDLTEKKNADDNLKKNAALLEQKNSDLEKMNKELQSFAYISSHDLQEPLRKIQTFSSLIVSTEYNNLSATGKDYFSRMQEAALRMQTLIDDLLSYSRTNTTDRKYETISLNKIVDEVKADLKEELEHKNATIEVAKLCDANIIHFQFRQLLQNLVSNSLKFSRSTQPPHIKIESKIAAGVNLNNSILSPTTNYCHIRISDNGIGFEPQFNERIFELFQRLHGRQEYSGTGIGLAIVKKIVENHDGIITAKGELDKGAIFDIYLPAK